MGAAAFSVIAPSQPGSALAGVQKPVRQHSPGVFFLTSPAVDDQLPTSCADDVNAKAASDQASARDLMIFINVLWGFPDKARIKSKGVGLPFETIVPQILIL
jgi:hypothetical protein